VVLVLDLGLGERRSAVDAPVNGLLALVDQTARDALAERARNGGLVFEVHRQVGMLPVPEDAQALELLGHDADEAFRVRAAGPTEVRGRHLAFPGTKFPVDLQLDGEAVTVIAGDVRGVVARHRTRLDDQVFQDLVERRSQVNLPVGVRRPIVQHVSPGARAARADLFFEADLAPPRDRLRLGHLQVGLHRKVGSRQIEGVFPLGHTKEQLYFVVGQGGPSGQRSSRGKAEVSTYGRPRARRPRARRALGAGSQPSRPSGADDTAMCC
jgi:hypothetical protein